MATHLMIVHPRYIAPILGGTKSVEARLGKDRRAPFGRVNPGDLVYIKPTGQRVLASARVFRVDEFEDLSPEDIDTMRETYDDRIMGGDLYWDAKRDSKFATLITLEKVALLRSEMGVPAELLIASRHAWRTTEFDSDRAAA